MNKIAIVFLVNWLNLHFYFLYKILRRERIITYKLQLPEKIGAAIGIVIANLYFLFIMN